VLGTRRRAGIQGANCRPIGIVGRLSCAACSSASARGRLYARSASSTAIVSAHHRSSSNPESSAICPGTPLSVPTEAPFEAFPLILERTYRTGDPAGPTYRRLCSSRRTPVRRRLGVSEGCLTRPLSASRRGQHRRRSMPSDDPLSTVSAGAAPSSLRTTREASRSSRIGVAWCHRQVALGVAPSGLAQRQ
jgi:hypothetical protein